MTAKEALVRLNQPFSYPPDIDSYFDAKEVAMKSLEKDLSIIEELEKIKEELEEKTEFTGGGWYLVVGWDTIEKVIDNHISELKGE